MIHARQRYRTAFGAALRARRVWCRFRTAYDLADAAVLGQDTIYALENGKQHPRAQHLMKLAGALNCSFVVSADDIALVPDEEVEDNTRQEQE